MKRKKHTPEQIVKHLRDVEAMQGAGKTIEDACRQLGVSVQTFYGWRKRYGNMTADELRRLKDLEEENRRLKKAVADLTIDKMILEEAASGNW